MGENTILVAGAKGGVGTSTVALNLSVQIAQLTRKRVALLDYARPFGQISVVLDFEPRFTLLDALDRIERLDAPLLASLATKHKSGVEILPGAMHTALTAAQRQHVTLESLARIVSLADSAFDTVIVDVGFVNAAEWSLVLQQARKILLVTEPSMLALVMLDRYLQAAKLAGIDGRRFEIILNRWRQNDDEMLAQFEKEKGHAISTRLPNDYRQLTEAVKLGMPLTGSSSNALVARYRDLARQMADVPAEVAHRGANAAAGVPAK